MQKIAQRRGILNKLREMTNVSGVAAEKFFNPQFQEVMENLRQVDDNIRSIVSGQSIDSGDPGKDPTSLKKLIQSAKSNLNRREYMTAVAELGRFHKKLFDMITEIGNLHSKVDEVHHQFLFQDLGDEHKQELESLKSRWASERQTSLRKEANIMDFFHNIGTARGRALGFYEKRYPKQVGKLKKDTAVLLSRSEGILGNILSSLKEMANARATRNVDTYMRAAEKLKKNYEVYDKSFQTYYTDNVKGFLEKIELRSPTQKVEEKNLGDQEVPAEEGPVGVRNPDAAPGESNIPFSLVPQTVVTPPGGPTGQGIGPTEYAPASGEQDDTTPIPGAPRLPSNLGPAIPQRDTDPAEPPEMEERQEILPPPIAQKTMPLILSHGQFFASLEALSGESPLILASIIRKYAKSIQTTDPATCIQLLKISSNIRN